MKKLFLFISVAALYFSCTPNTTKIDNSLQKYFDAAGVKGTFAMLNNQRGIVTVYNMAMDTQRVAPGSIFKIVQTLTGIETSRLTTEDSRLHTTDTSLAGVSLKKAFEENNRAYFDVLTQRLGTDTLQRWLTNINYGNMQVNSVDSSWDAGSLKISPDEQLGLMFKIYFDKLPYQKYAQQIIKELMLKEDNTLYKLTYATGSLAGNETSAWISGWIEENRHVYFFVTRIITDKSPSEAEKTVLDITKEILLSKGFFKGKN